VRENLTRALLNAIDAAPCSLRALAREAGYEAAVIARRRMNTARTDPFRLTRIWIDNRMTLARLRWTLFRLRWLHFA